MMYTQRHGNTNVFNIFNAEIFLNTMILVFAFNFFNNILSYNFLWEQAWIIPERNIKGKD